MADVETHEHDVMVIGAGGAGLRAAIEAAATGAKVGVICKSLLGKAHTVMAEGGIAAALANVDDRDNWRVHFADTMRGGQYLNNWRMAELHAEEAPERVKELEAWGALFDRTKDGRIRQRNFGGHRYPRLAHVGDRTGLEMIRTLQDHGIHSGMEVHMECTVLTLLLDSGRIAGAFGYDREKGHFILWPAKAVVLATGGIGRAFKITSNSWEYTGDGDALAYRAGAELLDMEFVQFHPTGMVWPISVRGILVTEGVRGEGGVLRNSEGRRFMFDDIPDLYKTQTADNEEEGWRYTEGEVAAGLHGANRLGGNSLSDLLVFGKRAGEYAAEFAKHNGSATLDQTQIETVTKAALEPFERGTAGENPYQIQYDLQESMQDLVGIVRTEGEMTQALEVIANLRTRAVRAGIMGNRQYNNGWHTAMDLDNMLVVSEAVTRAALLRKESRGAQFRDDFPDKDPEWGKYNIVIRRGSDGEMVVEKRPITPLPDELKSVIEEMK